jgi:uncharacterized membrane protein YhaH (DUF805 family)
MDLFNRYFVDTIKNKYVDFKGRASRSEFWYFMLFYLIISLVLSLVDSMVLGSGEKSSGTGLLSSIFSLAMLLPSLGVSIRRLHDIGRSGWWVLVSLVPVIGFIVLIIFYVKDSQPGSNEYGPNPKGA